ncbi:MAG: sulfotransferase [Alphaproteobacteria bacterium]
MAEAVTFHIGYHKTGTTFLQRAVFVPGFGFNSLMSHDDVARFITDPDRLDFSPREARAQIARRMAGSNLAPVVSSEMLCGNPYDGSREAADFAHRIHEIAPDARILITIREQKSSIKSTYMQYIHRGGTLPIERFLQPKYEIDFHYFSVRRFFYDRLVAHYMDLFGARNVLVVAQEEVIADARAALRRILAFAGADPSLADDRDIPGRVWESPPEAAAPLLRHINKFRRGAVKPEVAVNLGPLARTAYRGTSYVARRPGVKRWLKSVRPVSGRVSRFHGTGFAESNARLQALIGDDLDLSAYGYEMPPA